MHEMIEARKTSEKKEERYDLFSSLLDANEEEDDLLSESELMGTCIVQGAVFEENIHERLQGIYSSSCWPDMR